MFAPSILLGCASSPDQLDPVTRRIESLKRQEEQRNKVAKQVKETLGAKNQTLYTR